MNDLQGTYGGSERGCARAWEASAIEDGRLGAEGRTAFERHAGGCADCRAELAGLGALRRYVEADVRAESTPLERRRLRAEIIRRANGEAVGHAPRSRAPWIGALAAAAAIVVYVIVRGHAPSTTSAPQPSVLAAASAHYEVRGAGTAQWHATQEGTITRVTLVEGEASFHVEHLAEGQRFLVTLPDGEVEVRGTRFVVLVDHGRTRRVQVTEGRVALRVRDVKERDLYAGEAWEQGVPSDASAPTATAAPTATTAPTLVPTTTPPALLPTATPLATATAPLTPPHAATGASISAVKAAPTASATGTRFNDAMTLFRAARWAEAEAAFAEFEASAPSEPRAEDAAFLRAVARSRAGDAAGAARLAQRYLDRYPQGLRRTEAEALAKGAKP
jgi:TolA-binding protein